MGFLLILDQTLLNIAQFITLTLPNSIFKQVHILLDTSILRLDNRQWGVVSIGPGSLTVESTFPVAYTRVYRAVATHIAIDGHDAFGINIGALNKITIGKTSTSVSGTFTVAYLAIGY